MSWFGKHKILTVILVFIALAVIGSAASNSGKPGSSIPATADNVSSSTAGTQKTTSKPPTEPKVLLDISGNGTKQTQQFTAAGNWDLTWSYDCSSFGAQGNFIVAVFNSDGSENFDNSAVNQLGAKGSDVQHYYQGGKFYLNINSECSWHLSVKG